MAAATPALEPSPVFRRWPLTPAGWLLWGVAVLFIIYSIAVTGLWVPLTRYGVDFAKHYEAARALLEGRNPYQGGTLWLGFNYPQATAFAFIWLGAFDLRSSELVWKVALLFCLIASWWITFRFYRPTRTRADLRLPAWGLLTAFIAASYQPATSTLSLGNVDAYNLLLAVAMIGAILAGRERGAGVIWALLTLVKMLPLVLVFPALLWRRGRMLQGFFLTLAIYGVFLLVGGWWRDELYFVREIIPVIPPYWRGISYSPFRLIWYLAGREEQYWENAYVFTMGTRASLVVFGGFYLAWLAWMRRRGFAWTRALESALILFMLLNPLLEYHHYVWIYPALMLQLRRWWQGEMGRPTAVVLLAGWVLLQFAFHLHWQMGRWGHWVNFTPLVAYLIITGATISEVFRDRTRQPAPSAETFGDRTAPKRESVEMNA